ncbi:MAG: hypothetical protein ACFFDC_10375 [Promethearchaeota archaeon]
MKKTLLTKRIPHIVQSTEKFRRVLHESSGEIQTFNIVIGLFCLLDLPRLMRDELITHLRTRFIPKFKLETISSFAIVRGDQEETFLKNII